MAIPFLVFWVLLYLAREDLGIKGIAVAIALWAALLAGFMLLGIPPAYFVVAQVALDIGLILLVFGEDTNIG